MNKALHYLPISKLAEKIRSRQLSPVELTEAYLERIGNLQPKLSAFVTVTKEQALTAARQADSEIRKGYYRGPMHGVGFALKDNFDSAGVESTACSELFRGRIPSEDSTVTKRLQEAGGILLGKTTMSELAMVGAPGYGAEARNPWNTAHAPGWSSSGSGVAVAAGMCAAAMGTDSGGSVRFPASANGIVGMIATYGRVSRHGIIPLTGAIDYAGPLARTVYDTGTVLQTIAGYDPKDAASITARTPNFSATLKDGVRGLRLGVVTNDQADVDPEIINTVNNAIRDLESQGATLVDIELPFLEHAHIACSIIYLTEGYNLYHDALRHNPEKIGSVFRLYGNLGALFSATDYIQAQRLRSAMKKAMATVYRQVDALALPVTTSPAIDLESFDPLILSNHSRSGAAELFNLTGGTALSVPCGFSNNRLPIGLQLAARPFDESTLLQVAYTYEKNNTWVNQHPAI